MCLLALIVLLLMMNYLSEVDFVSVICRFFSRYKHQFNDADIEKTPLCVCARASVCIRGTSN